MRRRSLGPAVVVLAGLTALAACSGTSKTPQQAETPAAPAPASPSGGAPADPDPSAAPTGTAAPCPDGRYVLVGFEGTGLSSTRIQASGDDVTASFAHGRYTVDADGSSPYRVALGPGQDAELVLDGRITGRYSGRPPQVTYRVTSTSGSGTLRAGGGTESLPMSQLSKTLAPQGSAATVCTGDELTVEMRTVTLRLRRS